MTESKVVRQDGKRRVFILENGKEIPFDKINVSLDSKEKKKDKNEDS